MASSARLRASAGSDFVRPRWLLAKYRAASGLTRATGMPFPTEVRGKRNPAPGSRPGTDRPGVGPDRPAPLRPGSALPRGPCRRCRARRRRSRVPYDHGAPPRPARRPLMDLITGHRRRILDHRSRTGDGGWTLRSTAACRTGDSRPPRRSTPSPTHEGPYRSWASLTGVPGDNACRLRLQGPGEDRSTRD